MITLAQSSLVSLLVKSFLLGVAYGVLNDIFRAVRLLCDLSPKNRGKLSFRVFLSFFVTFFLDMLFWVSVGVSSVVLMYSVGGGIFRGVTYLAMGVGFVLYYASISRLTLKLTAKVIPVIKRILKKITRLIGVPISAAKRGIISLYRLTIGKIIGKIKEEKRLRREIKDKAETLPSEQPNGNSQESGKEAFVYVSENCRYRREGRIRF